MVKSSRLSYMWLYIFSAYAISWLIWLPVVMSGRDYQQSPGLILLVLAGATGPCAAAIYATYRESGRAGLRDVWERIRDFRRIRWYWWILFIVLPPAFHLVSIGIYLLLGGAPPPFEFWSRLAANPLFGLVAVLLYFYQGGIEEPGWRGYMQDRLQIRLGPLLAALLVGLVHTFWHLPTFFIVGTNQMRWGFGLDFWFFVAFVTASSFYTAWAYNDNGRSTLAAMLLHTTGNLSLDFFMGTPELLRIYQSLWVLGAVILAVVWLIRKPRFDAVVDVPPSVQSGSQA